MMVLGRRETDSILIKKKISYDLVASHRLSNGNSVILSIQPGVVYVVSDCAFKPNIDSLTHTITMFIYFAYRCKE